MGHLQTADAARAHAWIPPTFEAAELAPAPPTRWTPDHVAGRLIEAFCVDLRMQRIERPKAPGSAHPQIEADKLEFDDDGKPVVDEEALSMAAERYREDTDRQPPLPIEIVAMEAAFAWLLIVRESDPDAHFSLKNWAVRKATARSTKGFCKKIGVAEATFLSRKDRALKSISSKLNADSVIVF